MLRRQEITEALYRQNLSREAVVLLLLAVDVDAPKTVSTIRGLGVAAGWTEIHKWNVSAILKRAQSLAVRLPEGWSLTSRGREHVKSSGVLPVGKSLKVVNNAQ